MINIYRKVNNIDKIVAKISNKNEVHKSAIMSDDHVTIDVTVDGFLDIIEGDYIYFNGLVYTLNRDADYVVNSNVNIKYNLVFEHPLYNLLDKLYANKISGNNVFSLTGKLEDFVDLLIWNINYDEGLNPLGTDSGWSKGSIIETDYLNIEFQALSCRDALTLFATKFNAEFYFTGAGKTINFVDKIEISTGLTFEQGKGEGLFTITQQNVDNSNTITRIYPVGGNKNVRNAIADESGNLKLPEIYLENKSEYYKIVEKRVVFEDIYPSFIGTINEVSGDNNEEIICNSIDFDLNEVAVGDNARINFLTGALMGLSFQFSYDAELNKITLISQNDETALMNDDGTKPTVPSALKKCITGNKFNFTGIILPEEYENAAIDKLREKATNWLLFYCRKRVKFDLEIDHRWMRGKQDLMPGSLITIKIPEKQINKLIRITEISKNIYNSKITATVSNYLDEVWEKKIEGVISSLQTTVNNSSGLNVNVDIIERYDERILSDRNVFSSLRSRKEFLRKDAPDTATEQITFEKGAIVKDLTTTDFVQDKFTGSGAGIFQDEVGDSIIEVDKLQVRKSAYFNEIVINQIRFQGGIVVYSAASLEVLAVEDGGSYFKIYFDTKNNRVPNQFVVNDQIRCQRFTSGSIVKYYMSRITSVGDDYINISKSDFDGTLNPEIGDMLVQFGNRTDTSRQALIEVNVLDGGKQTFFEGVNSYSLTNKNMVEIGRVYDSGTWRTMIRAYGGLYFGNRNLSSYVAYNESTGLVEVKGSITTMAGTNIDNYFQASRNYLRKSRTDNLSRFSDSAGGAVVNDAYMKLVVEITRLSGGGGYQADFEIDKSSLKNTDLVFYAICKDMNGTGGWNFGGWDETWYFLNNLCQYRELGNGWRMYYKTFFAGSEIGTGGIGLNSVSGIWRFYAFGVCKGTVPPADWSAAPEDYQDEIDNKIIELGSDGVLTPSEKRELFLRYQSITGEHSSLVAQGTALGLSTLVNDYNTAYYALVGNGSTIQGYIAASGILDEANMSENTSVTASEYKQVFSDFFLTRDDLVNAISSKQNNLIDDAISDGVLTPAEKLQIKILRDNLQSEYNVTQQRVQFWSLDDSGTDITGFNLWTAYTNKYNTLITYLNGILSNMNVSTPIDSFEFKTYHSDYQTAKCNIVSFVDNWQGDSITSAINAVNKAVSDGFITPAEKRRFKILYDTIVAEKPGLEAQGLSFELDAYVDNYTDAYSYLIVYVLSIGLFADFTTTISVDAVQFQNYWVGYYQAREALKAAISSALNIKLTEADYLKEAIAGSTEISGGLLLTNLLMMKSGAEVITGGMSGLKTDPVAAWYGGTHADAIEDAASAFKDPKQTGGMDLKNGAGHRAFGNFAWNALGDVFMKGAIEALSGRFGNLLIDGDNIDSGSIKVTNDKIASLVSLLAPLYVSINRQTSWTGEPYAETQSFTIEKDSTIEFYLQSDGVGTNYGWAWEMYKKNESNNWQLYDYANNESSNTKDYQACKISAGEYYLKAYPYVLTGDPSIYISGVDDNDVIRIKYYESKAVFGKDGLFNMQYRNSYFYFKRDDRFTVRQGGYALDLTGSSATIASSIGHINITSVGIYLMYGNYGIRITPTTGLNKTTNGGNTWTNL